MFNWEISLRISIIVSFVQFIQLSPPFIYISVRHDLSYIYLKNSTYSTISLKSSILRYIAFFYHRPRSFPIPLVSLRWHVLISLCDAVDARGWRIDISVHSSSPFIANRRLKLLRHSAERTRRIHISRRAKPADAFHLVPTSAIPLFLRCSLTW